MFELLFGVILKHMSLGSYGICVAYLHVLLRSHQYLYVVYYITIWCLYIYLIWVNSFGWEGDIFFTVVFVGENLVLLNTSSRVDKIIHFSKHCCAYKQLSFSNRPDGYSEIMLHQSLNKWRLQFFILFNLQKQATQSYFIAEHWKHRVKTGQTRWSRAVLG